MKLFYISIFSLSSLVSLGQYSSDFVESKVLSIDGFKAGVIKMSRLDNHVKVKCFSARDVNNLNVAQRYKNWSIGKNIIAVTHGTYCDGWDPNVNNLVGLCIDNGNLVNNALTYSFDGLVIVYATGGVVVNNLKDKNFTLKNSDGSFLSLNITNIWDKHLFIDWAQKSSASIFQAHLLCYKDSLLISKNSSAKLAPRRTLAIAKDGDGNIHHYIINFTDLLTLYNAAYESFKILKIVNDEVTAVSIINLESGSQNILNFFKSDGSLENRSIFSGFFPLDYACNLLVYYYE